MNEPLNMKKMRLNYIRNENSRLLRGKTNSELKLYLDMISIVRYALSGNLDALEQLVVEELGSRIK